MFWAFLSTKIFCQLSRIRYLNSSGKSASSCCNHGMMSNLLPPYHTRSEALDPQTRSTVSVYMYCKYAIIPPVQVILLFCADLFTRIFQATWICFRSPVWSSLLFCTKPKDAALRTNGRDKSVKLEESREDHFMDCLIWSGLVSFMLL